MNKLPLYDTFERKHDYLRVSLTERCNLRCFYCMPKNGIPLTEKKHLMTHEEVIEIIDEFIALGIKKIRFTGGEPLIKKGIDTIFNHLQKYPDIDKGITTNGVILDKYKTTLKQSGINHINISLDTLKPEKFKQITFHDYFNRVWNNIISFSNDSYFTVKVNVVLIKGINDDEIIDFIKLTQNHSFNVRFIEYMPFKNNNFDTSKVVSLNDILHVAEEHFGKANLLSMPTKKNSTTRDFKINGFRSTFGIISTVSNPFCDSCNRIRLTASGKIKNCLFSDIDTDLLTPLRQGKKIEPLIRKTILHKKKYRAGMVTDDEFLAHARTTKNLPMTVIGG